MQFGNDNTFCTTEMNKKEKKSNLGLFICNFCIVCVSQAFRIVSVVKKLFKISY